MPLLSFRFETSAQVERSIKEYKSLGPSLFVHCEMAKPAEDPTYDVFLSYAWARMPKAHRVSEGLSRLGFRVFVDCLGAMARSGGARSTDEGMAVGVLSSAAIVCALCDEYALSSNARKELSYADLLQKPVVFANVGPPGYVPARSISGGNVAEKVSRLTLANRVGSGLFADARDDESWVSPAGLACLVALLEAEGIRPPAHEGGAWTVVAAAEAVCSCGECARRGGGVARRQQPDVVRVSGSEAPDPLPRDGLAPSRRASQQPPPPPPPILLATPFDGDEEEDGEDSGLGSPSAATSKPPQPPLGVTLAGLEALLETLGGRAGAGGSMDFYALERYVHAHLPHGETLVRSMAPQHARPATAYAAYCSAERLVDVVDALAASEAVRSATAAGAVASFFMFTLCTPTVGVFPEPQLLLLPSLLRGAARVVAVIDPLSSTGLLSRAWPLCELVLAMEVRRAVVEEERRRATARFHPAALPMPLAARPHRVCIWSTA